MKVLLIRHGKTKGNLEKRYVGLTDEPLCTQGIEELKIRKPFPKVEALYVSPLLRCRETAAILFPENEQIIVDDLRECDFGEFENKNYFELADNPSYQQWVDSMGELPFPKGESRAAFQKRCAAAFERIVCQAKAGHKQTIGIVAHGGTIMSIMEFAAFPGGNYYDFQVANGCGYELISRSDTCAAGFCYRLIVDNE